MPFMFVSEEVREKCYKQKGTFDSKGNPRTIVHHIDFNHFNDDPENLIYVSASEHNSIHKKGKSFNELYGEEKSTEIRNQISETVKKIMSTPEGKEICKAGAKARVDIVKDMSKKYKEYKQNGGELKWNDFQRGYRNGLFL